MQALAWVKYVAMLSFTSLQRWHSRRSYAASAAVHKRSDDKKQSPAERPPSAKARRLMVVIGLLDLVSYILHCVGRGRQTKCMRNAATKMHGSSAIRFMSCCTCIPGIPQRQQ